MAGDVATELQEGEPASVLLETAAEIGADELVVGSRGAPSSSDAGNSIVEAVLEGATRPVVVVPLPEL